MPFHRCHLSLHDAVTRGGVSLSLVKIDYVFFFFFFSGTRIYDYQSCSLMGHSREEGTIVLNDGVLIVTIRN